MNRSEVTYDVSVSGCQEVTKSGSERVRESRKVAGKGVR